MDFSHRRKNILTGEWIQVSPHRTKRPWQGKLEVHKDEQLHEHDANCYLCPGNKRANGTVNPNYKGVYVFDNDFPALQADITEAYVNINDLLVSKSEKGICKVLCFSEKHHLSLAKMELSAIELVINSWAKEYRELGSLDYINAVQIFENKGDIMGCSNPHPHGQIWAQESLPQEMVKEQTQQFNYFKQNGRTLLADYLKEELKQKERILFENNSFLVLVPYWAVWPFETMIIAKGNLTSLNDFKHADRQSLAEAIQYLTRTYDKLFACSFPYSAGIHQSPTDGVAHPEWTFHMHFYPPLLRSATVKKFMVGYEMMGNPQRDFTPEYAAKLLKKLG